jgi:ribosomal protein L40E
MIVCTRCGESSPPDIQFCGVCGTYLSWSGTEVAEQSQVLAGAAEQAGQPGVQQPTEARVLRIPTPAPTPKQPIQPGDLICGQCGTGNAPTRRFCRQCGHSLAEAQIVKTPWWRRLIPKRRTRRLGARPRKGSGRSIWRTLGRWFRRVVVALVALATLLYVAVPGFRTGVNHQAVGLKNWVESIFVTKFTPVRPSGVTATGAMPDHAAGLVADNAKNTYWAVPAVGEPSLVLKFDHPVDIRRMIVHSGIAADFESAHRPAKLHLVYSTGRSFDVTLADTPKEQTVDIGESAGATSIEVHIVALHRSLQGTTVAISEIELFEKAP